MKKYKVTIEGKTPYMQHRMRDEALEVWEKQRGRIIERTEVGQEDRARAEYHAFKNGQGYYIPSEHIRGALIQAGSFIKAKVGNSRKSMKNIVAAMFYVNPEEILLHKDFEIDKRSAVNKNIKARVISIRPKWNEWKVDFELHIDNDTITEQTINDLFEYAGNYVGIGSFRPQCNGMFGRFKTNNIKLITA